MVRQNSRQLENDLFSKAGSPTKRAKVDTEWQPASIDPLVELSPNAPQATKEFWFQNGHPHSKRYSNPELVSIGAIIRYNATVYQDMTGFLYPSAADNGATYMPITWGEFDDITETVAAMYAHLLTQELADSKTTAEQPTVAMLGTGNTVEYFITQMSLQKLNMRVLLLASGNSAEAIRHLLSKCNALAVIVDSRLASVDTNGVRKIPMVETIPSPNSTARRSVDAMRYKNNGDPWERQTFIIHSSGSTGPPKPLSHTNRSLMLINRMYRLFPDFHITNWILCAPLYHIGGLLVAMSNLPNGLVLSFPPRQWPPSPTAMLSSFKTLADIGHPVNGTHGPPMLIESWYEHINSTDKDFTPLTSITVVATGGAPLSDKTAKVLLDLGINLKATYGSTEIGTVLRTMPHSIDNKKCNSYRNLWPENDKFKMLEVGENTYECVIYKGFEISAEIWDDIPEGEPFRTNDIFVQDPPGSGNYILLGRKDDILVHSNGEKTNANAIQLDIEASCKIMKKCALMGHTRPVPVLLVELLKDYDRTDKTVFQTIWVTIEKVNEKYARHSRIIESMIYILPDGQSLSVTPKGNIKRHEVARIFEESIDILYLKLEGRDSGKDYAASIIPLPEFIAGQVAKLVHIDVAKLNVTTSFYDIGLDSISAMSLRVALSKRFGRPVSVNVIFENPSVAKLVAYFENDIVNGAEKHISFMTETIDKYSAELRSWKAAPLYSSVKNSKETILLTGASGSLGTSLLETLNANLNVAKVYAMVRGPQSVEKLLVSMQDRYLDAKAIYSNPKLEVLDYDMKDSLLGLSPELYERLSTEVTTVIHTAWKLNFNQTVEDFEDDCIKGTMNLLKFSSSKTTKAFFFTSSVSASMGKGTIGPLVSELAIGDDPTVATSTGYAQSKYIIERLCIVASTALNMLIRVLRVGQLSGHSISGHWNTQEMYPIMFATSMQLGAIPVFPHRTIDWLPVNVAAQAIQDVLFSMKPPSSTDESLVVHNIVNPHIITWADLVGILQEIRVRDPEIERMDEISIGDWVNRLNAVAAIEKNLEKEEKEVAGLKLLGFFEEMASKDEKELVFKTTKTESISKSLRSCSPLSKEWMQLYVEKWTERGFF